MYMSYKKLEKIIRFVETSDEKFIIVLEGDQEPVVLMPFSSFQEMCQKDEKLKMRSQSTVSLTKEDGLDKIESIEKNAESRQKPQLIRQIIKQKVHAEDSEESSQSKKEESPQVVPAEDRYYFEPVE